MVLSAQSWRVSNPQHEVCSLHLIRWALRTCAMGITLNCRDRRIKMDAVEFCRESTRMCKTYPACSDCPAKVNGGLCSILCGNNYYTPEQKVAIVEQWAKEHPRKTRQSVFLEQWPDAVLDRSGVMLLCPTNVSTAHRDNNGKCKNPGKLCTDCRREFWMQEVK